MKKARQSRNTWTKRIPAIAVLVVSAMLCVLAVVYRGVEVTQVSVDDGGIWVTNQDRKLVGHLNYDSLMLDGTVAVKSASFDIGQAGGDVTLGEAVTRTVSPVRPTSFSIGQAVTLPEKAIQVQGGPVLAVLDPNEGLLWAGKADEPASMSFTREDAAAKDLSDAVVTVSRSGKIFAYSPDSSTLVTMEQEGQTWRSKTTAIKGFQGPGPLSITAVGDKPVIYDQGGNSLVTPDGKVRDLGEDHITGAVLQAPGDEASGVLLATGDELVTVPLSGQGVTRQPASDQGLTGTPAPPVFHRGCAYGAWAGSGAFVRACTDASRNQAQTVPTLAEAASAVFRTNRTRIVLNDVSTGTLWLPDKNMVVVNNWDQIPTEEQEEEDTPTPDQREQVSEPEHNDKNTPPEAVDDEFGIRPGRSTMLPVLDNDSDDDGDVLTARAVSEPEFGTIVRTRGGRALQITDVPETMTTGSTSFTYEASDGLAGATANVKVTIHPWSQNEGPRQLKHPVIKVGANAQVEYNLLSDWIDPDGDQFFLKEVSAPDGMSAQFSEDGTVQIRDLGSGAGVKSVSVTLSDGRAETVGDLQVSVQEAGNVPPVARADFYVARVGEPLIIDPVSNDTDPNGDPLSLVAAGAPPAGTSVSADLARGTLTFTGSVPGSFQFTYTVSDGPSTTVGVIRVDVVADDTKALPIAEDDLSVLPSGGASLVAPLANDTDPSGGVLVVQSIDVPAKSGLEVTLIERHLLRITAPGGLTDVTSFTYTVSNGSGSVTAQVSVVPTEAQSEEQPPQAAPDSAKVRADDIGSVSVLANDRSPIGLSLSLDPDVEVLAGSELGRVFVTGNQVRLAAGSEPGVVRVSYTVVDSAGNRATTTVTFEIVAASAANSAPVPKPLSAWAVQGQMSRIPVPLTGIDPDGDSVALVGIDQPPAKGSVVLGTEWLEYTPSDDASGTDTFSYIVEDRLGVQGRARVRVGIAPPGSENHNPTAVPDSVTVRPGREVRVNVLANDLDADGDSLSVETDPATVTVSNPAATVSVAEEAVTVKAPDSNGVFVVAFQIQDGRGGRAQGQLTVTVDAEAPLRAPIARDDVVSVADLPSDSKPVSVAVLANDEDPDGTIDALSVSSGDSGVSVSGQNLSITPDARRRLVVYTATDPDGLSASAVVTVPGTDLLAPRLDAARVPVAMRAGSTLTLDIGDYVLVRDRSRSPVITDAGSVASSGGLNSVTLQDATHLVLSAPEDASGRASVSFTVRDGGADDASALSATLTIPITIQPARNLPPRLTPTPIVIGQGESVTVDLTQMVDDPDDQAKSSFDYRVTKVPGGVDVSLDGHAMTVSGKKDQPKGPVGAITVSVDDGSGAVSADIPVTIVKSSKPLVTTTDARVKINAGQTAEVNLAEYTTNPFPEPLVVLDASVHVGQGTASGNGNTLLVTPKAGFHGDMIVVYRVMDATNDPDRVVQGRVIVKVLDRPDPPESVVATAYGPGTAFVSFEAGAANGGTISGYTVTDLNSGTTFKTRNPGVQVTGLSNGEYHRFTVVAHNEAGTSDPSAPSAQVLIDVAPEQMAAPTVTGADSALDITWSAPKNNGSAIKSYTINVAGNTSGKTYTYTAGPGEIHKRLDGLRNGEMYTVSIQAHNGAETPSVPSPGAAAYPHGAPDVAQAVSASATNVDPHNSSRAVVTVSWQVGASGGRGWGPTTVTVGKATVQAPAGATQVDVPNVEPGANLPVTVTLSNSDGDTSGPAYASTSVATTPAPIARPRLSGTGGGMELRVDGLAVVPGNGFDAGSLTLRYAWSEDRCAGGQPITNGTSIRVDSWQTQTLYFCQTGLGVGGRPAVSSVVSASAAPTGKPSQVGVSITNVGTSSATVRWDPVPANPGVSEIRVSLGSQTQVLSGGATEATFSGLAQGGYYEATVTAVNSAGETTMPKHPSVVTKLDVAATWVAACQGGEKHFGGGDCHTFSLSAPGWTGSSVPHVCTVRSDSDNATEEVTVNGPGPIPSRVATKAGSEAAFNAGNYIVGECRPKG
ncbi:MAG: Ig-like domain-containing protein [Pauljensenia sp.]